MIVVMIVMMMLMRILIIINPYHHHEGPPHHLYHHYHYEPKSYLCIKTDLPLNFFFPGLLLLLLLKGWLAAVVSLGDTISYSTVVTLEAIDVADDDDAAEDERICMFFSMVNPDNYRMMMMMIMMTMMMMMGMMLMVMMRMMIQLEWNWWYK